MIWLKNVGLVLICSAVRGYISERLKGFVGVREGLNNAASSTGCGVDRIPDCGHLELPKGVALTRLVLEDLWERHMDWTYPSGRYRCVSGATRLI